MTTRVPSLITPPAVTEYRAYGTPVLRPLADTRDGDDAPRVERTIDAEIRRSAFDRSSILDVQ